MAIKPETEFPGKINVGNSNYPQGSARNVVTKGDKTGTPWKASLINDIWGFLQKLLDNAGITPSGSPDTALVSDYFDSLMSVTKRPTKTIATMKVLKSVKLDDVIETAENSDGNGGGGTYDIIAGTVGAAVGTRIIAHATEDISFVLRDEGVVIVEKWGITQASFQAALTYAIDNSFPFTSGGGRTFNITSALTATGTDTENLLVDFNDSKISFVSSAQQSMPFKNLKKLTMRNIVFDFNGGSHFGVTCETIPELYIEPTCKIVDISENTASIIIALRLRDCMNGLIAPTIEDIVNIPVTTGVARGVMVSDVVNTRCGLIISPNIKNIPGTNDGDGVFLESSIPATYAGGIKVINGTYTDCGKRNIKSHIPNVLITNNSGKNSLGTTMFAFVSAYGGNASVSDNDFETTSAVSYKVECGSTSLAQAATGDYIISDNQFKATGASSSTYMINMADNDFNSIVCSGNIDTGAGRVVRGIGAITGDTMSFDDNKLFDVLDSPFNLGEITLETLLISKTKTPDVASKFFVVLGAAPSIGYTSICNNSGDFSFGTLSAPALFRPDNLYSNGTNYFSTSSSFFVFRDGKKEVHRNASDPTSGEFLKGDVVTNTNPGSGTWKDKTCTTAGTAGSGAVFSII